ncbi:MAG: efflux RND transporter permease subunit [Polyangiaceae bacterium]
MLARYDLDVDDITGVVEAAVGGNPVTVTVEGRKRYTVNVRYKEDFRASPDKLRQVLVPLPSKAEARSLPLGDLADIRVSHGPPMLRNEAGLLVGYVYVDLDPKRDVGTFVTDAKRAVASATERNELALGSGMYLAWTGQYELLEQMRDRMRVLVPLALVIVLVLLYFQFKNLTEVFIVMLSIPFALVGSVWALWLLDYRLSTAVWVGVIALVGLAAQTGVVMIVYIDQAFERRLAAGLIRNLEDIIHAHTEGTVQRVRPKLMTVSTMLLGLVPLLWATGSGADVMKRIAAPMVGGLATSAFLTLELIPVVYTYWRFAQLKKAQRTGRPLREVCGLG